MHFIDFEVFKYDWLCVIIDPIRKKETVIINDKKKLERYYTRHKDEIFVGYNIRHYDQWILKAILCGFDPKEVNDWIVVKRLDGYRFSGLLNKIPLIFFDVMPNPPVSLKTLEGFMGNNIKESSVDFRIERKLTQEEIDEVVLYCRHDVEQTVEVFLHTKNEFDSQLALVKEFKLPLNHISKTQAQLAAVILGAEKKTFDDDWAIRIPETLQLKKYRYVIDWFLDPANHNEEKKTRLETTIAGIPHVFAWGGVHGAIKKYCYTCAPDEILVMADVDQLYPTIMIKYGLLSRAVNDPSKFKHILDTSLRLKAEGKKKEREPYKRICNITYGTEGAKFNNMYDPLHRKLVCVFGQLLIVDLIEKIEGFSTLIQSNTDGILLKIKRKDFERLDDAVYLWEQRTGLHMSFDIYKAVYQGDVNNYIVAPFGPLYDEKGKPLYKGKGDYAKPVSPIDYDLPLVKQAVKDYLLKGTPVETTIYGCDKLIEFQKIVKLSDKFEFVEHNGVVSENKSYRVFASKDRVHDTAIRKCKLMSDGKVKKDKFANTALCCFIVNDSVNGVSVPEKLDRDWYVDLTKKRLKEKFGVIV